MKLIGADKLARTLREIPTKLAKQELREILREAAVPFADRIEQAAPKGDPTPPNISDVAISSGRSSSSDPEARIAVGPPKDAFYGYFQEHGFYDVPGKGFMRSAFDSAQNESQDIIQREIWARIRETSESGTGL